MGPDGTRRGRTRPGWAWPLTTKELVAGLGDQWTSDVDVVWYDPEQHTDREVLALTWHPERDYWASSAVSLWITSVPDAQAERAAERLVLEALPACRDWIADALAAPPEWQGRLHSVRWSWVEDRRLVVKTHDGRRPRGGRSA